MKLANFFGGCFPPLPTALFWGILLPAYIWPIMVLGASGGVLHDKLNEPTSVSALCGHRHLMVKPNSILATNSRSDTLDVLHYDIHLNITNLSTQQLTGHCVVTLTPKMDNINQVLLDLEDLEATAVTVNNIPAEYTQSNVLMRINLPETISIGDTVDIDVHYNGNPPTASFGGFYFQSGYAYNLGIGIGVDPPNYGRAWFPCFDNFTERSTYSCHITTAAGNEAICGGILQGITQNSDGTRTWNWHLNQNIPTYLASVAVSNYDTISYKHLSITGDSIPVLLAVRNSQLNQTIQSLANLPQAISSFEHRFGPYRFDRVGFVVVPFSGGAMEHATNIAYPSFAIDGTVAWESLMAHEFSHHWFGDLVTCETAGDMWLNEGWASYCEKIFFEALYGTQRYKDEVRKNHKKVLQTAHISDGGYLSVGNVPFEVTYGAHVYNKGADIAHSLRGYVGNDTLFFDCLQNYLHEYAFRTANSAQFRDFLSACSGIDLSDYFNDWVWNAGFSHFSIDSFEISQPEAGYMATVYIRQRSYAAPNYHNKVPLQLSLFDENLQRYNITVMQSGGCMVHDFNVPFLPVYVGLDLEEKIGDATTDNYRKIGATGNYTFAETEASVDISQIGTDTLLLRMVYNWAMPDRFDVPQTGLILSPNHYWTVEGYCKGSWAGSATFNYNGSTSSNNGYLDNALFLAANEQNLRLLYRPNSGADWTVLSDAVLNIGSSNSDKRGSFSVPNLQLGEYALAYFDPTATDALSTVVPDCQTANAIEQLAQPKQKILLHPNPTADTFKISIMHPENKALQCRIYSIAGQTVYKTNLLPAQQSGFSVSAKEWAAGVYIVNIYNDGRLWGSSKVVVE